MRTILFLNLKSTPYGKGEKKEKNDHHTSILSFKGGGVRKRRGGGEKVVTALQNPPLTPTL